MDTVKKILKSPFLWLVVALVAGIVVFRLVSSGPTYEEVPSSQAYAIIMGNEPLKEVILTDQQQLIQITKADDTMIKAYWVGTSVDTLITRLDERQAAGTLEKWNGINDTGSWWGTLLGWLLPMALIIGLFVLMMSSMGGGAGGRVFSFGRSRAKVANKDTPKTTFADVAGVDEAVEELQEIKEFLAEPGKFKALGAKIPKGVLLYGPPGTGKTLLARAVAGEAGVPFYSISGSDFVEMFVGVGASRVRDLFDQAKANAPAIVFIDEIDAVGRHRGAGMGGGHDEREQTLNQLLVEMDGFDAHGGVILIAATNRPDVLDPALLRPGRFDRQIAVDSPDLRGRYKILQVHADGKPLGADVDLQAVARRTPGFTGADLANVLNEAALLAARTNKTEITNEIMDESIDRVVAGPQKRTRVMNAHEILVTAYHEGGHALVAAAMPGNDPVQKITILPRGQALGYTMVMPDQDRYSQTRGQLLDQLAYMLGGRAAEELIFHDPTTGASNDIEKATKVARAMVTQYGMTESLGAVRYGSDDHQPFVGMEMGHAATISPATAATIDAEVAALINNAHQEAFDTLVANREILDELVRQLLDQETLDKEQVAAIFADLKKGPPRQAWTGSPNRQPSEIPPVPAPDIPEPDLDADLTRVDKEGTDSAAGQPAAGPSAAGPSAGQYAAGQPGPYAPGQWYVGQPGPYAPGQPGQYVPGQPGQWYVGQPDGSGQFGPVQSETIPWRAGQNDPGQPGQNDPGQSGQDDPGQPGQNVPGQPGQPDQSNPDQPGGSGQFGAVQSEISLWQSGQDDPGQSGQDVPGQPGQPGQNDQPSRSVLGQPARNEPGHSGHYASQSSQNLPGQSSQVGQNDAGQMGQNDTGQPSESTQPAQPGSGQPGQYTHLSQVLPLLQPDNWNPPWSQPPAGESAGTIPASSPSQHQVEPSGIGQPPPPGGSPAYPSWPVGTVPNGPQPPFAPPAHPYPPGQPGQPGHPDQSGPSPQPPTYPPAPPPGPMGPGTWVDPQPPGDWPPPTR